MTDWNGETTFELDLLNRIVSANDHKGDAVSYSYDAVGNQTSIAYPDNTKASYEYDLLGRMTKMTDSEAKNTSYAYDAASQLISQVYPNGWKEFTVNSNRP
jgi:YD repeat-containing protein